MTTTLSISPMRLDFNNTLRLDRCWPEAPHGWQKYEAKEVKYASSGTEYIEKRRPECTVQFRRCQDYDNSFGFDWLRVGDTSETGCGWYRNCMDLNAYDQLVAAEYRSFSQQWKQESEKYKATSLYVIPWVTLMKGNTAKFRVKLEVNKPSGILDVKVIGREATALSVNLTTIDAQQTGDYYNSMDLKVTCNTQFSSELAVEIRTEQELVGKMIFVPNTKTYSINIVLIPVKIVGANTPNVSSYTSNLSKYFKQAYVTPNFSVLNPALDLTKGSLVDIMTINKKKEKRVIFDAYFRNNPEKRINTSNGIRTFKNAPDGLGGLDLYAFLDKMLCYQHPQFASLLRNTYRLYCFDAEATAAGQAEGIGESFAAAVFKTTSKCTPTHEILHCLGLRHTFDDKNKYLFRQYYTDNIMDYIPNDIDSRNSLLYWQIKHIWNSLNQK